MSGKMRWKKALSLAAAAGIVGLFAYGVAHTAAAYGDIQASPSGDTVISGAPADGTGPAPLSPFCHPLGCAACAGCTDLIYQENIGTLPDSEFEIEQTG